MMDIFNREKVKELTSELEGAKLQIYMLKNTIGELRHALERQDAAPEDCKPGPWCGACEFSKAIDVVHYNGYYGNTVDHFFVCDKDNVCVNFLQKEVKE